MVHSANPELSAPLNFDHWGSHLCAPNTEFSWGLNEFVQLCTMLTVHHIYLSICSYRNLYLLCV